jgi:hypothetical protein
MSKFLLNEIADKYYTQLNSMVDDLAQKCTGGEQVTVSFPSGKVTIKLY